MSQSVPPILFLIFNRPSTTREVFAQIREAKPDKLFIAADGPRPDKADDKEKCQAARSIASEVDWECEVKTLFREDNLGCGPAVSGAITWFFEHVEEGIILEDDTKPSPDFFRFCAELLPRYRNDLRIMQIAGYSSPSPLVKKSPYSYYFSDGDNIWGWATWRRAWKHYDYAIKLYPEVAAQGYITRNYTSIYEHYHREYLLYRSYYENDKVTFWDPQWGFARKINSGLVVVPTKNLVVNLGFGADATNTVDSSRMNHISLEKMEFPLKHPEFVLHDRAIDDEVFQKYSTTAFSRLKDKVKYISPAWFYGFFKNLARK